VQPPARGPRPPGQLGELARLFLRLGTTAFGGPAAHIAMMEDEVVARRGWLTREQFLDLLGATNLIPGPNSTELAIPIGHARAGFPGLVVAGACFILPAALIVSALGWAYVRFGALPQVAGLLYGAKPVVIAVVVQALWRLFRSAVRGWETALVAVADELVVLGAAAALTAGAELARSAAARSRHGVAALLAASLPAGASAGSVALWPLFGFFVKVGSVLFGSGYVLLAFLRSGLVEQRGWLSEGQLLDAIAVGQVTPGPVFTTATFIGYVLAGGAGAAVATAGIFLPAFVFVALSAPLLPRLRQSRVAGALLDGVNAASLALMAVVTARIAGAALVDLPSIGLAVVSAVLLLAYRVNSGWLVAAGAAIGLAVSH